MKRRHVVLGLGGISLTVVLVMGLAYAATLTAGGFDSTTEELIIGLNRQLTFIAVPIAIVVEAVLIYTAVRYRNNDDPKPTEEHRWLEISWTIATAIILVLVGVLSSR